MHDAISWAMRSWRETLEIVVAWSSLHGGPGGPWFPSQEPT